MVAKRGIMFELQTSVASDADDAFDKLGKKIDALQQKANLTLSITQRATRTATAAAATVGGNGAYGGNGAAVVTATLTAQEQAEKASQRRRADMRRKWDEEDRIRAEKIADTITDINQEALDQQIKDLKKAQAEKEKLIAAEERRNPTGWAGLSAMGRKTMGRGGADAWQRGMDQLKKQNEQKAKEEAREEQKRQRDAKEALAHQREGYARLRESVLSATDAVTRLGEGMSYLGLIGERDLHTLTNALLKIRGTAETIRGLVGTAQNLGALRQNIAAAGGRGALLRTLFGLGAPAAEAGAAGAAGSAGLGGAGATGLGAAGLGLTGAGLATAGVVAIPIVIAGEAALNMATSGRSRKAAGRAGAAIGGFGARMKHAIGRGAGRMFMDEGEKIQEEFEYLSQQENPYAAGGVSEQALSQGGFFDWMEGMPLGGLNPLGLGARMKKNAATFEAEAASRRNLERHQKLSQLRSEQLHRRIDIENTMLPSQLQEIDLGREQAERLAAIGRNYQAVQSQHAAETAMGIGKEKLRRQGFGEQVTLLRRGMSSMLEGSPLQAHRAEEALARLQLHEELSAEKIGVLTGKRERTRGIELQRSALRDRSAQIGTQISETREKLGEMDESNVQGREQAETKIKQLIQEQEQIKKQGYELDEKHRKGEIQDAAKLVELAQKRAQIATQRVTEKTQQLLGTQERLGMMTPMDLQAMVQAMRRAKSGEELTYDEISVLDQGTLSTRTEASKQKRMKFRNLAKGNPELLDLLSEETTEESLARQEQRQAQVGVAEAAAAPALKGEVTVGGEYSITIDIRDDMQLAKELRGELSAFDTKLADTEARIMKAVRGIVDERAKQIQQQRRTVAGGGG